MSQQKTGAPHGVERDLRGPEVKRSHAGTTVEAWSFWPNEPALRCRWPTAALACRLLEGLDESVPDQKTRWAIGAVLHCYVALLTHPAGVRAMVQRLRALRRAERGE